LLRVSGLWLSIAVVMVIFGLINGRFFASDNLIDLVRSSSTTALIALGLTLVIVSGELDLSIGSTYGLAPILFAVLWMKSGMSAYLAIVVALLLTTLGVGLVNAFFTIAFKMPSFVVTLGTLSIVSGISLLIGGADFYSPAFTDPPLPKGQLSFFETLGASEVLGIPVQVVWLLAAVIVFSILLHRSLFGFRLAAIGGNEQAARFARLPVGRYRLIAFVVCSLMAALAGLLDFSFLGSTQPGAGSQLTFPVFAAVIIGGASLTGGSGTVIGTITGAILLGVLSNGLSLIGVGGGAQLIFVGSVTIIAVAIDRWTDLRPALAGMRRRRAAAAGS
jgi:ribose/xylose/arabinose/galactoside ABC-type transport system permease subunit